MKHLPAGTPPQGLAPQGLAAPAALALLLAGLALAPAPPAAAETALTFGTAQNITSDADVSTDGSLVFAYAIGSSNASTVNGVTFGSDISPNVPYLSVSSHGDIVGSFSNTPYGVNAAPYSGLSAGYQQLLGGGIYTGTDSSTGDVYPMTFTLSGLTAGDTYQLEYFVSDSRGNIGPYRSDTLSEGGSTVSLAFNTDGANGGLGQYVLGTFVADASGSESFTATGAATASLSNGPSTQANALQLRDLGSAAPEPSEVGVLALIGLALGGLALRARRKALSATE